MKKLLVTAPLVLLLAACGHSHTTHVVHHYSHQGGGYYPAPQHTVIHQHTTVNHYHPPARPRISVRKH